MSDNVAAPNSGARGDERPPGRRLTRPLLLEGHAAVAGAATAAAKLVDVTFLGDSQLAAAAAQTAPELLVRRGTSVTAKVPAAISPTSPRAR
jgi:hypothetical protein